MDKTNMSFLKFVYKILLFILSIPFRIVKYFCLGLFYTFYVFAELIVDGIILVSFGLYKLIKYFLFSFLLPIMLINILKRKSKKEVNYNPIDEIVTIPDNAFELNLDLNKEFDNNLVTVLDEPLEDDKFEDSTFDNKTEISSIDLDSINEQENFQNIEDNVIAEPINDNKEFLEIKNVAKKRKINLKKVFLPFELISYPVYKLFKYIFLGFVTISFYVYKLFKYLLFSLGFFVMIYNIYSRVNAKKRAIKAKEKLERLQRKNEKKFKEKLLIQQKQEDKLREELKRKKEKESANIKPLEDNRTFKEKFDNFINDVLSSPKTLFDKIKNSLHNSVFAKDYRNKKDMSRQVLLINFEGEDAEKSDIKVLYQYTAKDTNGRIVTDYFEAYSKVEVHSFLLSEGYEVYNIKTNKWIQFAHKNSAISNTKVKNKDLIFFLTQLSTYIKAGIPLVEALKILTRQYSKNRAYQKLFRTIIYDLTMGENFSTALEKQKDAFPRILINMVKASELTGELPEVLDDMAEYFTEIEQTKKQMVTALMYPMIILVFAIAVIIFILVWVIPQFVDIYNSMDSAQIPKLTLFILSISEYLKKNYLIIILIVVAIVGVLVYLYKNVKVFRTLAQWLFMHMPIIGNVIIYNEVTIFTKTFSSLLSHNVFITDSMNILNKVTNNEIYKMIILDTITNLAKGEKISKSFENHWAFPIPAYEMLVTGEKTGQLPEMMKKVSEYYQDLHKNSVTRIKTFIEPILIVFLTVIVGVIVLAIVVPMFNLYQSVQGYS